MRRCRVSTTISPLFSMDVNLWGNQKSRPAHRGVADPVHTRIAAYGVSFLPKRRVGTRQDCAPPPLVSEPV